MSSKVKIFYFFFLTNKKKLVKNLDQQKAREVLVTFFFWICESFRYQTPLFP